MSILSNKCPRCRNGEIYSSFFSMNEKCESCGYAFNREPGYFVGAMFLNYMFLSVSCVPILVIPIYLGHSAIKAGIMAGIQMLILSPFSIHYARLFWIQMDYKSDPQGN